MSEWDIYFENEDLDSTQSRISQTDEIDLGTAPSQPFTDSSFPPDVRSLVGSFDQTEKLAKNVKDWFRIPDINPKAQLFVNGTEAGDIKQFVF
jgi:hypothetical protein